MYDTKVIDFSRPTRIAFVKNKTVGVCKSIGIFSRVFVCHQKSNTITLARQNRSLFTYKL